MGRDNFTETELKEIAEIVDSFNAIMLREQSTVAMLQPYVKTSVEHVIDPVGLIDLKEYESIAVKPKIDEPYAVMYLADSSELLDRAIEKLSKELNMKIVHICGFKKKCYCDYFVKDAGPEEILGYILNADFIISASFHATLFSLLFQKQFVTLLPGERTNARIKDVLSYVCLEDRIVHDENELFKLEEKINYFSAMQKIENLKKESEAALLNVLSETGKGHI